MYEAIEEQRECSSDFSTSSVLKILGISRSAFYAYENHQPTKTEQRRIDTTEKVLKVYLDSHCIYGSPKIMHVINNSQEDKVSQRYVYDIMKKLGIKPKYIKHTTITTRAKNFSKKLKNILKREFNPDKPDAVWCTDITYIWTYEDGFVYLTSVIDLFARKIVGWVLTRTMDADVVLECIRKAKRKRNVINPMVIHSDRGVQYTSELYDQITEGMTQSYSRKGNPWDNACIESWHALIKRECLNNHKIMTYEEAKKLVFNYIEGFYNTVRIHSHCDFKSPDQYEMEYYLKQLNKGSLDKKGLVEKLA